MCVCVCVCFWWWWGEGGGGGGGEETIALTHCSTNAIAHAPAVGTGTPCELGAEVTTPIWRKSE
jgi:hypothetical protein